MGDTRFRKDFAALAGVLLISLFIFDTVTWYDKYIYYIFESFWFLNLHILTELLSVIMAFTIFAVTFYTFEKSNKLRSIIIAVTFFSVAFLDTFHFLSYQGMPRFLTEASAVKATTFWTIARLTAAGGLFSASLIKERVTVKVHRSVFLLLAIFYVTGILLIVNYRPELLPALFVEGQGLTQLKVVLEYSVIVLMVLTAAVFVYRYIQKKGDEGYVLIIIALIVSVFSEAAFTLYQSVYDTYNLLGHIYKVVAYYLLFRALFVLNVQKPYLNLREAEQKLSVYADELEKRVAERTAEIQDATAKLEKDLDYAKNIQTALLPVSFPRIDGMDFAAKYLPCEKVGGDFYDVFRLDDDNLGIVIGDVAGHGVSAAMVNVFINQNINSKKEFEEGRYRIFTPRGVLMNLFHVYNEMPFPEELYLVMFYGIYNLKSRELTYASAGMNTPPLILSREGKVRKIELDGFPICKFGKYFKPSYDTRSVTLEPGDTLIFYTDGLVEINRDKPQAFDEDGVVEFVKGMRDTSAVDICEQITDAYRAFLGDGQMLDDVTLLVIKTNEVDANMDPLSSEWRE